MSKLLKELVEQLSAVSEVIERLASRPNQNASPNVETMLNTAIAAIGVAINCLSVCDQQEN